MLPLYFLLDWLVVNVVVVAVNTVRNRLKFIVLAFKQVMVLVVEVVDSLKGALLTIV